MNLPFRQPLAAGFLLASVTAVSMSGVANANDGHGSRAKAEAKSSAKTCKKPGKSYKVHGAFSGGELARVAGGATERRSDDRYSGTVVVDVTSGNRRGLRDLGLRSYAVSGIRIFGITSDGELPAEGANVDLAGKLKAPCAAGARRSQEEEAPAEEAEEDVTTHDAESEDETGEDDRSGSDDDSGASDSGQPSILDAVTDVNVRVVRFQAS